MRPSEGYQVVSIGYEGRSVPEMLRLLRKHGVRKVIDVRELPLSRRRGFSKSSLSASLAASRIEYTHLRAAGNPHRHLKADPVRCLRLYTSHLANHPEVLDCMASEISGPVAVLCFERAHHRCHRSRLLDALVRTGGGRRYHVVTVD